MDISGDVDQVNHVLVDENVAQCNEIIVIKIVDLYGAP